jgi:hypothetical protein
VTGAYFIDKNTIAWPDGRLTDAFGNTVVSNEFEVKSYPSGTRTLLYKKNGREVILKVSDGITFQRVGMSFPVSKAKTSNNR